MQKIPTFYPTDRAQWRRWLQMHHATEKEIWLLFPHKSTGLPCLDYGDAVQEGICFGWIDGVIKKYDADFACRRWTPRRPGSGWSELNKHHARLAMAKGQMTPAGQVTLPDLEEKLKIPQDVLARLQADPLLWKNFCALPPHYQQIRLDYILRRANRPALYEKTLAYFCAQTRAGKRFGPFKDSPEKY